MTARGRWGDPRDAAARLPSTPGRRRRRRAGTLPPVAAAILAVTSCGPAPTPDPDGAPDRVAAAVAGERWRPLMRVVVDRLRLSPGERVFGAGDPDLFPELPGVLAAIVEDAGGSYVGTLGPAGPLGGPGEPEFVEAARGLDRSGLRELLRDVPVGVMLPGSGGADPSYAAMVDLLREGLGSHRTVHFHWGGAYAIEDLSVPVGAEAVAAPTGDARADTVYRRAILELDYDALAARQRAFETAARAGEIRVTTPSGTDIRFRIGDRPVSLQNGDASAERAAAARILIDREIEFPVGALRVAPLEGTVRGVIAFPRSRWDEREVENLALTFEAGRITRIEATSGADAVRAELAAAGEAPQAFRELAVGFNPLLAVPEREPWLPYFGYGAGVVRLSLGDNSELGGTVGGWYVKWVFFLDATLDIDGHVWVEGGRLLP